MGRRDNELYIGPEYMNIEGAGVKHPALIKHFAEIRTGKISTQPLSLIGIDIETNHKTAELKLLGIYDEEVGYRYYTKYFISVLYTTIKSAYRKNRRLAYWNRLDPFVIFKQFALEVSPEDQVRACAHYGKISGEWDRKAGTWKTKPVIAVKISNCEFGIIQAIRSSIQFYYKRESDREPNTVWAYDIAQLYDKGIETEAQSRLPYYSKLGEEYHKIDWERFEKDETFRKNVLLSNELDARACKDLGDIVSKDFYKAFGYYPVNLISAGSLARASIVASVTNKLKPDHEDEKQLDNAVRAELKAISIASYLDNWTGTYGPDVVKDLLCMSTEAYSGGYIEAIRFGYAPKAYYADIASAYPGVIVNLWDLRDAKITNGTGEPPHIANSYCFVRGVVDIPLDVNYHPITVRHPLLLNTNIRAVGTYRASYTIEERDFLLEQGATFTDEKWINIETTGKLSPLAEVTKHLVDLRTKLRSDNDTAEQRVKKSANSIYGITFEATDTHQEKRVTREIHHTVPTNDYKPILRHYLKKIDLSSVKADLVYRYDEEYRKVVSMWGAPRGEQGLQPDEVAQELLSQGIDLEAINPAEIMIKINELYRDKPSISSYSETYDIDMVYNDGYRAGEFYNPIFACYITSRVRIQISKACQHIENKGGKVLLLMTDSIFWTGKASMMPQELYRDKKTLGYFEKPKQVKDFLSLGTGRYGYRDDEGFIEAKRRGLNVEMMQDKGGMEVKQFDWIQLLKTKEVVKGKIALDVKVLVSVGMVANRHDYNVEDLGLITTERRNVDLIVGRTKRLYDVDISSADVLLSGLIDTAPVHLGLGMFGNGEIVDRTLSRLREKMACKSLRTQKGRNKDNNKRSQKKWIAKNGNKVNNERKTKYQQLRDYGYTSYEARDMAQWSFESIEAKLKEDGKI